MIYAACWKEYREHRLVLLVGLIVFLAWPAIEVFLAGAFSPFVSVHSTILFAAIAGPVFAMLVGALGAAREVGLPAAFTRSRPIPASRLLPVKWVTGAVVVFSWFHVNLLGIGLHSYGFSSGLRDAVWTSYLVQAGFVVVGTIDVLLRPNPVRRQVGEQAAAAAPAS